MGREVLPGDEAAGARLEIERRLLNASRRAGSEDEAPRRAPLWAAAVVAVVLVGASAALYLVVGRPSLPDQPFTGDRSLADAKPPTAAQAPGQAAAPDADKAQFEQLIAQLEQRMVANPGDEKGWLLLARGLMRLDRANEASTAYAHALQLDGGEDMTVLAEAAEAHVIAAGGKVDAEAAAQFRKVAAADPKAPQPRYYLALAKAQKGRHGRRPGRLEGAGGRQPGRRPLPSGPAGPHRRGRASRCDAARPDRRTGGRSRRPAGSRTRRR